MGKICPKTGSVCSKTCTPALNENVKLAFDDGKQWFKVTELKEIFDKMTNEPYMLVAGNTAHGEPKLNILFLSRWILQHRLFSLSFSFTGVYRRSDDIKTFIDITGVQELHRHQMTKDGLVISANVSLTELMDILTQTAKTIGFQYVTELVNHIDLIANVPVRNVKLIFIFDV